MQQSQPPSVGGCSNSGRRLHQGWLWERMLFPGECQRFEISLDGYVPLETGHYKLMGDGRFIEGAIAVPNPCEPAMDPYRADARFT